MKKLYLAFMCTTGLALSMNAQNVGIGQPVPVSKLDVNNNVTIGTAYSGVNAAPANGLNVEGQVVINRPSPLYAIDVATSFADGAQYAYNSYVVAGVPATGNVNSAGLYARVDAGSTGGVGILVDHFASSEWGGLFNAFNINAAAGVKGDADLDGPHGVYGEMPVGAAVSCALYANGDICHTGGIFNVSDINTKQNIQPYIGGLSKVMAIQAKSYEYKPEMADYGTKQGAQIGFIAQELEVILPAAVRTTKILKKTLHSKNSGESSSSEGTDLAPMNIKVVDYVSLIPVLTQAIQEQQKQIEELKAEVEALKK